MSTVRTLPIRVTPTDGEAIDSWLEATAHRVRTAYGDLLTAVGLSPYNGMGTTAWIVRLNPDEVACIEEGGVVLACPKPYYRAVGQGPASRAQARFPRYSKYRHRLNDSSL